jgi:predicted dehydrogenase
VFLRRRIEYGWEEIVSEAVKWGVLGVAKIAVEKVIPAMQRGAQTRIEAIASREETRAQQAATLLGISKAYGSYEQLLNDPEIEAIYNPLPNELHVYWTEKALAAGKHVLCEKPIALDAAEARRLVAAREASGRLVAEAFMVRFHPQWRRAREIVHSGAIGQVGAIQTLFTYRLLDPQNIRNRPPGGGGLYDIGCYAILTARYIFGAEPIRVAACLDIDPKFGSDRLASAIVEFPNGQHLTFSAATQLAGAQRVFIAGTAGRIEVQIPFNAPVDRPTRIVVDNGIDLVGGGARVEEFPVCDQYTLQGDAFSRAIHGDAALEFPIEDAVANMAVIDACFRAAQSGRWEQV